MLRAPVVALVLTLPVVAAAEPISLRTTARTELQGAATCSDTGVHNASCEISVPWTNEDTMGATFQSATAEAAFGTLTASSQNVVFEFSGGNSLPSWLVIATAEFTDHLTVTGDSGNGFIQYLFSGFIDSVTDPPGVGNGFAFSHDGSALLGLQIDSIANMGVPIDYVSPLLPFTFGVPFELYVYAQGSTGSFAGDGFGMGAAVVTLDGLNVFNSNQQMINGRIISEANAPYATPVPEPASVLLFGSGLVATAWRRRRIKTQR